NSSTDLMGDEPMFEPRTFSCLAPEDSLALVDFYHAMGGETWVQPWRLALPVSTWAGITLSAPQDGTPQRVIAIKMGASGVGNNNMKGYIPASLGELSELTELNIAADLEGGTEDFLGGLTRLKSLTISHSQRANFIGGYGERPKVTLSDRLFQLEDVYLEGVSIENLNLLWQNRNLQQVSITFVDLANDPVILETADTPFPKLHTLILSQIKGATGVSGNIYNLGSQLLNFDFSVTTDNIAEHINLDFATLIEAYPAMQSTNLELYDQQIPSSIGSWKQLTYLNLMGDLYGELPDELFQLPRLGMLMLQSHSRLTGTIPQTWTVGKTIHIFGCDGVKIQ
ncbi:MAG: hypothetical protein K2K83_05710, partial [Rikenella sp.]|nr:hypothetical protein [Rikenella sp.]